MNISVIGCEYFNDYQVLKWHLDELEITQITTCGNCEIDTMASRYAEENNIRLISLWPVQDQGWIFLWKEYYRLVVSCERLLVFWYGENIGVNSMIKKAKRMDKEVTVIRGYHSDMNKRLSNLPPYDVGGF